MVLQELSRQGDLVMSTQVTVSVILASIAGSTLFASGRVVPPHSSVGAQSDEERAERLFERFKRRYDQNFDGRISKEEFPRLDRAFRRLDRNSDGYLTLSDFQAKVDPPPSPKPAPPPATPEQERFFETRVRPVLANACYSCHSDEAKRLRGNLQLDSLAGLLKGGTSGPAVIPGDPDNSELILAIRYDDPDFAMPPKGKLDPAQIADLERWVELGAHWPDDSRHDSNQAGHKPGTAIDLEAGRQFWSFRPVVRTTPPTPKDADWVWSPIDSFLRMSMQTAGVLPIDDASDRTWLRRVTFDLTGLPPTPEDIANFQADKSDDRDARVVDRLLASKAYAERWGRHWLDVARYAESSGKEVNVIYPHAWRYRDWVIKAFDEDLPYDQFLAKQIAGDLEQAETPDEQAWNLIATGYLAIGSKGHSNRDDRSFRLDVADEQIDALSQGMLGLTISCARCHDHKFDPIPSSDYYSLAGILLSSETHFGTYSSAANRQTSDLISLPSGADIPNGPHMTAMVRRLLARGSKRMDTKAAEQDAMPMDGDLESAVIRARIQRLRDDQQDLVTELLARFDDDGEALPSNRLAMGMSEGQARDVAILHRGELDRPGDLTPRRIPQVFTSPDTSPITEGSGRRELADWIASEDNPLTARVWANRIWLHLFGTGLVPTPDNFGAGGLAPTHPELLDWLAAELVASGWSTKALIRAIALSHAYRLDSRDEPSNSAIDPAASFLWRMPERRMEAEALRDAMLAVSGALVDEPPIGSQAGSLEGVIRSERLVDTVMREQVTRSIYLPSLRGYLPNTLAPFDAPDSAYVTGDRDETNVATQALFLMNDSEVLDLADAFAKRLRKIRGKDKTRRRIQAAFEWALGRKPSTAERNTVKRFLRDYGDDAWSAFAQSLFQSAEFRAIG